MRERKYDFVVAGAGLSSHLPGVVASKVEVPVFGVPVDVAFGGLDSFFSIVQMPFGVPVIACGASREHEVVSWAAQAQKLSRDHFKKINLLIPPRVFDHEFVQLIWEKASKYAREQEVELKISDRLIPGEVHIAGITDPDEVVGCNDDREALVLHNYLMEDRAYQSAQKALEFFLLVQERGGLWSGVNNIKNSLCALLKVARSLDG